MNNAGAAFRKAAQVQQKNLSEPLDAANSLNEAFKCYRQTEPQQAASAMSDAIQIYTAQGNFRRAATNMQTLAELYETGLDDQVNALKSYETAANWFSDDNAEALANKLLLKAGEIAALIGETDGGNKDNYYKAIAHFEKVSRASVDNNLMRWSVKDYLLKGFIARTSFTHDGDYDILVHLLTDDCRSGYGRCCRFIESTGRVQDVRSGVFADERMHALSGLARSCREAGS